MSSFLNDISEVKEMNTGATPEYKELVNMKMATDLSDKTPEVMRILSEDLNQAPFELINPLVEQGHGVFIESSEDFVRASVIDKSNQRLLYVDMSAHPVQVPDLQVITEETQKRLEEKAKDPLVIFSDTQTRINKGI